VTAAAAAAAAAGGQLCDGCCRYLAMFVAGRLCCRVIVIVVCRMLRN